MSDLAVFFGGNLDTVTVMAMQLEACMLCDEDAQRRYQEIYGRPWVALSEVEES